MVHLELMVVQVVQEQMERQELLEQMVVQE